MDKSGQVGLTESMSQTRSINMSIYRLLIKQLILSRNLDQPVKKLASGNQMIALHRDTSFDILWIISKMKMFLSVL